MRRSAAALSIALILVLVSIAFLPCLKNGFVRWDDQEYLTENPVVRDLSLGNLKKIFSSFYIGNYQPLTMLSYLIEYRAFKLDPWGYHLTGVFLHLLNSLLVLWLFYLFFRKKSISLIVAVLFAVHPLHVESVAWVSERKDLLYSFFFLASLIFYYYYLRAGRINKFYYLSLIAFVLSLLSKSMALTLPVVLILFDYVWRRKPDQDKKIIKDKIPFFALAFIFGIIALFSQYSTGTVHADKFSAFATRVAAPSYGILFYLNKILLPMKLACLYPIFAILKDGFMLFYPLIAVIILFAGVILSAKHTRKVVFGFLFFLVSILPVLQFVPIGETFVADRYTYIASIGIFYILAEGLVWLYKNKGRYQYLNRVLLVVFFICVTATLISFTRQKCLAWKDSLSLWNDVLDKYPDVATAHNNRGTLFLEKKEYEKAYFDFMDTLRIDPDYHEAYFNLGSYFWVKGDYSKAVKLVEKVIQINPGYMKAYDFLAIMHGSAGKHSEVINIARKALQVKRDYAPAYVYLCGAYGNLGNFKAAIVWGEKAIALDSGSGLAYMNLAAAYFYAKQYDLAIKCSDKAMALGYPVPLEFLEALKKNKIL
jgi:protein O-mannosyl-transferase